MQKVIPITMEVGGEKREIGSALLESDPSDEKAGDVFLHGVIFHDADVVELLDSMNKFSINPRGDAG